MKLPLRAGRAVEDDLVLAVVIEVGQMRLPVLGAPDFLLAALIARHAVMVRSGRAGVSGVCPIAGGLTTVV